MIYGMIFYHLNIEYYCRIISYLFSSGRYSTFLRPTLIALDCLFSLNVSKQYCELSTPCFSYYSPVYKCFQTTSTPKIWTKSWRSQLFWLLSEPGQFLLCCTIFSKLRATMFFFFMDIVYHKLYSEELVMTSYL